ncbi:oxygen-independent coproporphyrinogen III oxidase [Anaerotignum lactatifermentans]|uniref:Heme chaperone HemW n=1 Tax=Anaerotignum lactatifermentans TaxID=160404 RepID=A0ABS2G9B6_9FIRM|nr:radical SAM family heme chaperone HemW [Anaerotignum lactatifermentans]MBM6829742.1 oxygen-independent coproporphyrinogen III oxidase [Anaerotignum lactatifermentans]MBM6877163.1 oxygen-independent coproporphyrinogen III oxidase [Anaerotignum lactatifermentans]MBM6951401.1 oxygen-independent coproporphyrinogen III oxidase [Anaerotignum lactatifermentans]
MKEAGLYIHIPFCRQKCFYCDFPSFAGKEELFAEYTDALCRELEKGAAELAGYGIKSVFVGGGTPTVLPMELMERIMGMVFDCYEILPEAEITTEANPGTLDEAVCRRLKQMGFNRLSMGLQAWQDELLLRLGRIHDRAQFLENLDNARRAGFDNINADLMFALPGQTLAQWEETLDAVIGLGLEHISAYSLIIEEGTPFYDWYEKGVYQETDEETDRAMYAMTQKKLTEGGYHQYEISNFAKEGKESRHNKIYWLDEEYHGFGMGAHSYWQGRRFHNPGTLEEYIRKAKRGEDLREEMEKIPQEEEMSEFMFLGLRMTKGIEKERFLRRFGKTVEAVYGPAIVRLKAEDLLEEAEGWLRLTQRGVDVSNHVFVEFLPEEGGSRT